MPRWPWSWPRRGFPIPNYHFPNLIPGKGGNHKLTSWSTSRYNCIAWAADDPFRRWWPGMRSFYWPSEAIDDNSIVAFIDAFHKRLHYDCCNDGLLEPGFEKVAFYASPNGEPLHAARQLPDGSWTSKMGMAYWPDIHHDTLDVVSGPAYGTPVCYMKRERCGLSVEERLCRLVRIWIWEITTFWTWLRYGGKMYDDFP
jgi:hypothetical protein